MLGRLPARGGVPVDDHLQGENEVEHKAREEAVQDEVVGDFLHGGEDAGDGSEEVGEDLLGGGKMC